MRQFWYFLFEFLGVDHGHQETYSLNQICPWRYSQIGKSSQDRGVAREIDTCGCSNQNLGVICLRYPKVSFKYFPKLEDSGLDKIIGGVIRPTCRRCHISKLPELLLSQNIQAGSLEQQCGPYAPGNP